MKCARLHLQERRTKVKFKAEPQAVVGKPRRYCQKRLVDPDHEEDPRWMDLWDRFHYNVNGEKIEDTQDSPRAAHDTENIVLTVQTLKFQGDVDQTKRPRTSFKYKSSTDGNKHRMFVKEIVTENEYSDDDRSSQLTYNYFDDYVKYLCNTDRSRSASSKSSIFLQGVNTIQENIATPIEITETIESKEVPINEPKIVREPKIIYKRELDEEVRDVYETINNTKIAYEKIGKRKSLTISRTESPETIQVIRVDVVCNQFSSTVLLNYEATNTNESSSTRSVSKLKNVNVKNNHFANRYLLTDSVRTLDENLSGGSKVTLLCKTFKLSDRSPKVSDKLPVGKTRKLTKNNNKSKNRKKVVKETLVDILN